MFTLQHFIWLGIMGAGIGGALFAVKKYRPTHKTVSLVVMAIAILMKLIHVSLSVIPSDHGGMILNQTEMSFHLCSMQIYFLVWLNLTKNESTAATLKSFMVPSMMIGACISLFLPTNGVEFSSVRVWQYMIIHAVYVFYGTYLIAIERVELGARAYAKNLLILTGVAVIAFYINSILAEYGTNYLYLREPPMENLPLLNLNNGWYAYLVVLVAVAVTLMTLVHLPFMIKRKEK